MATKLDWEYQENGEYYAYYNGHRIRAVLDDSPANPFTNDEGNWPILVRSPDKHHDLTAYVFGEEDGTAKIDVGMFTDAALVHNQVHIAKVLGWNVGDAIEAYCTGLDEDWSDRKYCSNPGLLRDAFDQIIADRSMSKILAVLEQLYTMAGWPCHHTTVTGYSQGDWAEVLVIAAPAVQEKFGCKEVTPEDLAGTAKLYKSWAFGDVYGYVVEKDANAGKPAACTNCGNTLNNGSDVCDQCEGDFEDPEPEFEEIPDGSCWGFYGTEFDESGLEESAMECIPEMETEDA